MQIANAAILNASPFIVFYPIITCGNEFIRIHATGIYTVKYIMQTFNSLRCKTILLLFLHLLEPEHFGTMSFSMFSNFKIS